MFWDVMPCGLTGNVSGKHTAYIFRVSFGETYCLLKMDTECFYEKSVSTDKPIRRHSPEHSQLHRRENLKSHFV
jgi:hypothetical protein